jgi:hypothetical protein
VTARRLLAVTLALSWMAACSPALPDRPSLVLPIAAGKSLQVYHAEETWCRRAAGVFVRDAPWTRWAIARAKQEQAALVAQDVALGLIVGAAFGRAVPGAAAAALYGEIAGDAETGRVRQLASRMQAAFDGYYVQCMSYYGNAPVLSAWRAPGRAVN